MNYEEKYREALKVIESLYNVVKYRSSSDALLASQTIEKAFPELRESEDEKIRKALITFFQRFPYENLEKAGLSVKDAIAWLEKQGEQILANSCKTCKDEQKPSWSEEDEKMCQETIDWFEKKCFPYALEYENPARESIKWLKSLKDRVQPHPKQEWSKDDKEMLDSIIDCIDGLCFIDSDQLNWLKSLKPNHWKPSEEQMEALETTIHISNFGLDIDRLRMLESLYNDLKKL